MSDSEEMRLGKGATFKGARSPPRIKFPAQEISPALSLHEGSNHGEKPTHNCPPQRLSLPLFFHHEGMANRIFWRPKVRSFCASPFFAANVLRRQNHGQRGIFVHQTLPMHLHIGGRTNM